MKIVVLTSLFLLELASILGCSPQQNSSSNNNLQQAFEVLQKNNDYVQAMEYLEEQLKTTPDNAEALYLRAQIHRVRGNYGEALSDISRAIKVNKPRVSGIATSTLYWWKGYVYDDMNDNTGKAEMFKTALSKARKDDKDNVQAIAFDYAQALFDLNLLDKSDIIYKSILKEDETNQIAIVGLARNMKERGRYQECISLCKKSMKYNISYAGQYKFIMQAYDKLGEIDKAIDNGILLVDNDLGEINNSVIEVFLKHKSYALAKIHEKEQSSKNKVTWIIVKMNIYEQSLEYEKAISEYDALEVEYGRNEDIYLNRAKCYEELGMIKSAISDFKAAIQMNYDVYNISCLGDCYRGAGMYKEAIETYSRVIDKLPSDAYGYYARGWCHELSGDDKKALEDYENGIDVDKTYPYIFLMRGQAYLKLGLKEKANADFEAILQLDTIANSGSCRHYALHFLGRDIEAQEWMENLIRESPEDYGNWYDQACLFSRMGQLDRAVASLEKCLELGYCKFPHISHDDDLDAIRDRDDFKALIKKYSERLQKRLRMGISR